MASTAFAAAAAALPAQASVQAPQASAKPAVAATKDFSLFLWGVKNNLATYLRNEGTSSMGPNADESMPDFGTAAFDNLFAEGVKRSANAVTELDIVKVFDNLVNERIKYTRDFFDEWQRGYHTAQRGRGDCEDFAFLKAELLLKFGIPAERLGILVLGPKGDSSGHAVATYISPDGEDYVMNNNTDKEIFGQAGVFTVADYLLGELGGGTELVPLGSFNMQDYKFQISSKLVGGKMALADMQFKRPDPPLADFEKISGLKDLVCALVSKHIEVATPDQACMLLSHNPKDFADLLKDSIESGKFSSVLKADHLEVLQAYARVLGKPPTPEKPQKKLTI